MLKNRGRPRLGQHFLRDTRVADRAVAYANVGSTDTVLEIGPGKGVLTRPLAAAAKKVVAIELDAELADALVKELPADVELLRGDAVKVAWPAFDLCVSNLPYQVSSPILFRLLDTPGWRAAVLMVQREFAERLVAKPDTADYGRLTVMAAALAKVEILERVPPGVFAPPPRVDSALVRLTPREPPLAVRDRAAFADVVARAFSQRRKKLANALSWKEAPHGDRRAGELSPEEFAAVADAWAARRS